MATYQCADCPYCRRTADFFICWCAYWQKTVRLVEGCTR